MNKTAIRTYAIWARDELLARVTQRAYEYGITADSALDASVTEVNGRLLSSDERHQRAQLIDRIVQVGYNNVVEEAAYTWFNRFIALRFMEINNLLPSRVRVFSNSDGEFKPDILQDVLSIELEGLNKETVAKLLEQNRTEELYRYLLMAQCRALSDCLPQLFEHVSGYTELLCPNGLLKEDGIIGRLVSDIPAEDWSDQVQIIGWLYQFYITEKHAAVIDPLHGKVIDKEDIPAATQLFTTDWVVRYILDNSLGRYWLERHPESSLASKLTYLVTPQSGGIKAVAEPLLPEELTVFDPCVGSGHFLSYAFDILMEIYRECGWSDRDAAVSIVKNNLYGVDIDDRAVQLACFAIMMKARRYNRRLFEQAITPHIVAMQDSTALSDELIAYVANGDSTMHNTLYSLKALFENAKEFGSLIDVPPCDLSSLYARLDDIDRSFAQTLFDIDRQTDAVGAVLPLVKQADILSSTYDIVATNPPYMNKYSDKLRAYLHTRFPAYKSDLFSVFMFRNFSFCNHSGYSGFMTPNVWMFIKTYEPLRRYILEQKSITTLVQTAKGAFFKEATVDVCAFVLANKPAQQNGIYICLEDFKGDMDVQNTYVLKALQESNCRYRYEADAAAFATVPGSPIAYRLGQALLEAFVSGQPLGNYALARNGMKTGDNDTFLRLWWEISRHTLATDIQHHTQATSCGATWFPYNKGGEFRKWYGNNDYVVNWKNGGDRIFNHAKEDNRHVQDYPAELKFTPSLSWSLITSGKPAFRYKEGNLSDIAGMSLYADKQSVLRYLGLLNSSVALKVLSLIAPTINFQAGDIARMPVSREVLQNDEPLPLIEDCIDLSRRDWDSFEASWDFKAHPLV